MVSGNLITRAIAVRSLVSIHARVVHAHLTGCSCASRDAASSSCRMLRSRSPVQDRREGIAATGYQAPHDGWYEGRHEARGHHHLVGHFADSPHVGHGEPIGQVAGCLPLEIQHHDVVDDREARPPHNEPRHDLGIRGAHLSTKAWHQDGSKHDWSQANDKCLQDGKEIARHVTEQDRGAVPARLLSPSSLFNIEGRDKLARSSRHRRVLVSARVHFSDRRLGGKPGRILDDASTGSPAEGVFQRGLRERGRACGLLKPEGGRFPHTVQQ